MLVTEGEFAYFEQYLLLSHVFQKSSAAEVSELVYMWERISPCIKRKQGLLSTGLFNPFPHTIQTSLKLSSPKYRKSL